MEDIELNFKKNLQNCYHYPDSHHTCKTQATQGIKKGFLYFVTVLFSRCFSRKKKNEATDLNILTYLLQLSPLPNILLALNSSPLIIMQSKFYKANVSNLSITTRNRHWQLIKALRKSYDQI